MSAQSKAVRPAGREQALGPMAWLDPDTRWPQQSINGDWHLSQSGSDDEHDGDVDVLVAPPQLQPPPLYTVVLFNDDYTPMEFVIEVLQRYFGHDLDRATEVMLTVHYRGKGIAGVYPRDIAETKAQQVNHHARSLGHPLLCQIEPQPQ